MNDTAELMQRTVPLTWNKPEWMLPEAQNEIQKEFGYTAQSKCAFSITTLNR